MANEGVGRLFRRPDGKYLVYVPVSEAEDSMFPLQGSKTIKGEVNLAFMQGQGEV